MDELIIVFVPDCRITAHTGDKSFKWTFSNEEAIEAINAFRRPESQTRGITYLVVPEITST